MFVNFSNHSSTKWDPAQAEAAARWGEIVDVPFPVVPAEAGEEQIEAMADEYTGRILDLSPKAVMCQGEFTLCYSVIRRLKEHGVTVVAACSARMVAEQEDEKGGKVKTVLFRFARFREYK